MLEIILGLLVFVFIAIKIFGHRADSDDDNDFGSDDNSDSGGDN